MLYYFCFFMYTLYLCVAVLGRYLFWTEWGQNPCIGRSRLDGSDQVTLVNSGIMWPNGISIDYEVQSHTDAQTLSLTSSTPTLFFYTMPLISSCSFVAEICGSVCDMHFKITLQENTLYWCDARTDKIERINLETGEGREIVLSVANVDLFSVAVFGPYIYWSDR